MASNPLKEKEQGVEACSELISLIISTVYVITDCWKFLVGDVLDLEKPVLLLR